MRDRDPKWGAVAFVALLLAAHAGNWLLSRSSNVASATSLGIAWAQLVGGSIASWAAWHRAATVRRGHAV